MCFYTRNEEHTMVKASSLKSGEFSTEWKEALVTPVHKKGEKDLVGNYRPIYIYIITTSVSKGV